MREIIYNQRAPKPSAHIRRRSNPTDLIFVSGQVAIDPATQQVIAGDVAAQTDRVMQQSVGDSGGGWERAWKVVRCDRVPEEHERFRGDERGLRQVFQLCAPGAVDGRGRALAERCAGGD